MGNQLRIYLLLLVVAGCTSGGDQAFVPRPRMYPYVDLPQPKYGWMKEKKDCGFVFRKSNLSTIESRTTFFKDTLLHDCWFDLVYPEMEARVHFTYYPIGAAHPFQDLVSESFQMVYEHSSIASRIDENPIIQNGEEAGMSFELKGPVASPYQFFLSDTTDHFIRAALYFNSRPNPDSIAPILAYIRADLDTLVKSFEWQ